MNTFRQKAYLFSLVLVVMLFPPAARAQPAPGVQGATAQFGRLVDRSGGRTIAAGDTEVSIYNGATGLFETQTLLATWGLNAAQVTSISIEGTTCVVTFEHVTNPGFWALIVFAFDGAVWNQTGGFIGAQGEVRSKLHDGLIYSTQNLPGSTLVFLHDIAGTPLGNVTISDTDPVVAFDVGDGATPSSPNTIVVTTNGGSLRHIRTLTYDGSALLDHGVQAIGIALFDYGAALAIDAGWCCVGAPGFSSNVGRIEVWKEVAPGTLSSAGSFSSSQVGDRMGRAVALSGEVMLFSGTQSGLIPTSSAPGSVRVARYTASTDSWFVTTEVHHALDVLGSPEDDFGVSLALDGLDVSFGEPGAIGGIWNRTLPATSMIDTDLATGLGGQGGIVPIALPFGTTYADAPFVISVSSARASAPAFLVLGLSAISAPFKGGVLLPDPDVVLSVTTDGAGEVFLATAWPDSAIPFTLFGQVWVEDGAAPHGFSASNGWSARQD